MPQPTEPHVRKNVRSRAIPLCLFVGLLAIVWTVPALVLAQGSSKKQGSGKAKGSAAEAGAGRKMPGMPGAGMMPPPGMMPGAGSAGMGMPGMRTMPGMPGAKKPAKKRPTEGAKKETDPDKLPRGFVPPPEPPESMTTSEEWDFDPWGDTRKEKTAISQYKTILANGELRTDEDKKLLENVITWKLAQMTRKENREKAAQIRVGLFREVSQSGSAKGTKRDARIFGLQTIVKQAPKLLEYHFTARLNAAVLLADLAEVNERDAEGGKPAERCILAQQALIKIVNDRKQDLAVRIRAVVGLTRIALVPELKPALRFEIVQTLTRALQEGSNQDHYWYLMRLAEGLGEIGVVYDSNNANSRRPIVPQALAEILVERKQTWVARSEAAKALGRLAYEKDVDLGLIAYEVAELGRQMTEAYQKDPQQSEWKLAFFNLYATFKPITEEEARNNKGLLNAVARGPLAAHRKSVQEAYDVILPLAERVVSDGKDKDKDSAESLTKLSDWLKNNPPKAKKIAETEPELVPSTGAQPEAGPQGGSGQAG